MGRKRWCKELLHQLITDHPLLSICLINSSNGYQHTIINLLQFLTFGAILSLLQLQCYIALAEGEEEETLVNNTVIVVWVLNIVIITCISWMIRHIISYVNRNSTEGKYSAVPTDLPDTPLIDQKNQAGGKTIKIHMKRFFSNKTNKTKGNGHRQSDSYRALQSGGTDTFQPARDQSNIKGTENVESTLAQEFIQTKCSEPLSKPQSSCHDSSMGASDTLDKIWSHVCRIINSADFKKDFIENEGGSTNRSVIDHEIEAFARSLVGSVVATVKAGGSLENQSTDNSFLERRLFNFFSRLIWDETIGRKDPEGKSDVEGQDEVPSKDQVNNIKKTASLITERNLKDCCKLYAFKLMGNEATFINKNPSQTQSLLEAEQLREGNNESSHSEDRKSSSASLKCTNTQSNGSTHSMSHGSWCVSRKDCVELLRRLSKVSRDAYLANDNRLDITIKASMEMLAQPKMKKIINAKAQELLEENMREFVGEFINDLCIKSRRHIEAVTHNDNKHRVHQLLSSGDIIDKILPTLAEFTSDILKEEYKCNISAAKNLQRSVMVGQYIDTLVTNAFLRTEHVLEYSCDYLTGDLQWQVNNNNANELEHEKQRIMSNIIEQVYLQLDQQGKDASQDETNALFEQRQRITSQLSEMSSSDVGTYLIWHTVQRAHDKVTDMCDSLDIRQLALQRGWIEQLSDNFLIGGSGFQDHLSIVEMTSDHISGVCLGEACAGVAEELIFFLSSDSVDEAVKSGLLSLKDVSYGLAEEETQRQLYMYNNKDETQPQPRTIPTFSAVARIFVNALRVRSGTSSASSSALSPTDSVSSFSHSSVSGGTPTPVVSLEDKLSLAITDSNPYVMQVTSLEDMENEPLVGKSLVDHTKYEQTSRNDEVDHDIENEQTSNEHSRCNIYTIIALFIVTAAFTCANVVTAMTLNSDQMYTWVVVLLVSFLVHVVVLEPVKTMVNSLFLLRKNYRRIHSE